MLTAAARMLGRAAEWVASEDAHEALLWAGLGLAALGIVRVLWLGT